MKVKQQPIAQVYNAGVISFYSKQQQYSSMNTPIRGKYTTVLAEKHWFRQLGVTAEDIYYARSLESDIHMKVAIRGNRTIDTKWIAKIGKKTYEIYRMFYSYGNDETEISLTEVIE